MNNESKTIWRKSWRTPPWFRIWLGLLLLTLVLMTFLTATGSMGWPSVVILPVLSIVVATVLLILWLSIRWFSLLCWYHWRRAFFLLACLATAIAMFYAEENWRGRHDFDQFKRAGEARGEHFDLASLVPPPVPDDQNFALTPVVASSYGEYLDRTGHEILPRNTNVVNRLHMDYWGVNYNGTNVPGDWAQSMPTDLTGWQQFYRSMAAKTNLFPVPQVPQSPAADVLLALSRFAPVIEELRQAGQLPLSRFPLEYDKENPAAMLLPHLASLKISSMVLQLRAIAELQTGQSGPALDDIALIERLINSVQTEPILISQVVRMAIFQLMLQPVWEGLADHIWSDSQLAELDAGLAKFDFVADYQAGVRGERAFLIKEMDFLRNHPDQYPDLIPSGANGNFSQSLDIPMIVLSKTHLVPAGWYYQNQLHCALLMEKYLSVANLESHTLSPVVAQQSEDMLQNEHRHISPFNTLECLQFSWIEQFSSPNGFVITFAHAQSSLDLARVAIALERYRLAKGKYPDSLDALYPQYLNPVPHDVINGQPLHYQLTDVGQFVLYSIGWNGRDDGGVVVLTTGKSPHQDITQGDWVWRYPHN